MFNTPLNSGLTFTKVLSGISKTLNIANQVIPIYKEAKPMINNAKTILSVLKGFNTSTPKKSTSSNDQKKDTISQTSPSNINSPSFFQ